MKATHDSSTELISKVIKVRMLRLNLDQKTLAEKSNISPSALGHYLSDKTECRVSALDKVLKPLKWDSIGDIFKAATDKKRRHQRTRRLKKTCGIQAHGEYPSKSRCRIQFLAAPQLGRNGPIEKCNQSPTTKCRNEL